MYYDYKDYEIGRISLLVDPAARRQALIRWLNKEDFPELERDLLGGKPATISNQMLQDLDEKVTQENPGRNYLSVDNSDLHYISLLPTKKEKYEQLRWWLDENEHMRKYTNRDIIVNENLKILDRELTKINMEKQAAREKRLKREREDQRSLQQELHDEAVRQMRADDRAIAHNPNAEQWLSQTRWFEMFDVGEDRSEGI